DFWGSLELFWGDGTKYVRDIGGASCDEVAPALAFVLALALDERMLTRPNTAVDVGAGPSSAGGATTNAPPADLREPNAPTPPPASRDSERSDVETSPRSPWQWGAGLEIGVRGGNAPKSALVESAFAEMRQLGRAPFAWT